MAIPERLKNDVMKRGEFEDRKVHILLSPSDCMDYTEAQGRLEENVTYPQAGPDYMNARKPQKKEPVTPIQRESVITREDVPNPIFRFLVTFVLLIPILAVAAIYYGIINP